MTIIADTPESINDNPSAKQQNGVNQPSKLGLNTYATTPFPELERLIAQLETLGGDAFSLAEPACQNPCVAVSLEHLRKLRGTSPRTRNKKTLATNESQGRHSVRCLISNVLWSGL